jgi:hypothetical protein
MSEAVDRGRAWQKSRACADGACVEVGWSADEVLVRNSLRPEEIARFTPEEWAAFIAGVKAGDFAV